MLGLDLILDTRLSALSLSSNSKGATYLLPKASSGKELDVNAEVRAALREGKARSSSHLYMNCCMVRYDPVIATYISGGPQTGKPFAPKKKTNTDASQVSTAPPPRSTEPAKVTRERSKGPGTSKPSITAFTPTKSPPCKRSKSQTDPSEFSGKSTGSGSTTSDGRSTRTSSSTEGFYSRARRFSPEFGALA